MEKSINRCMGCMCEKNYLGPCEMCGYTGDESHDALCLAPKTLLADRYVIGRVLTRGGECTVYIAFDTVEQKPVEIKEFMPDTLCVRAQDGVSADVKDGCLPLYKSYLSEFADLHKTLMSSMDDVSVKKVYGIFASGNTGYVVMEHLSGMTLTEYLDKNGGLLSWGEVKGLFPPVFDALKALHEKGIVHRGLSTDTLFMSDRNRLTLTSLGISAGRTADSQINSDMISGYAAGEQYALSERQGSWTDVYGISAVLYRTLTGKVPPSAELRAQQDTLVPPIELNPDIPKYVSDALLNGMKLDQNERFHDIDSLMRRLYTVPTGEVNTPDADDDIDDGPIIIEGGLYDEARRHVPKQRRAKREGSKKKKDKKSGVGTIIGFALFFALVIALTVAIIYFSGETEKLMNDSDSTQVTEPEEPDIIPAETTPRVTTRTKATTKADVQPNVERLSMPKFVGRFYSASMLARYSLEFTIEYEYNDSQTGLIFEQSIEEGTEVYAGTEVTLKVSKGSAFKDIPDFIGMKVEDYLKKLDEAGIKYETETEETDEVKAGYVSRLSKEIGEKINISEEEAETLTVYYAVKPKKPKKTTAPPDEDEIGELDEELEEDED